MAELFSGIRQRIIRNFPPLNPGHRFYPWLVLVSTTFGTFMGVLDATIVNVAISNLMTTFGVSTNAIEWVLTAYLIIFGVTLPASGWLADHIGYKRTFLLGLALFTVGSFLAAISWNISALITFRVIQGAGAGLVMPVGMATITREFPLEKRGLALGFWAIAASASASLGPTIGGYLLEHFSWNTIFTVNVPIGVIGLFVGLIVLREYRVEKTRAFDFLGFLSLSAFLTTLILALSNGNASWNTDGWKSNNVIECFAIAAASILVFTLTESAVQHPIVDLSLFKDRNFAISNFVIFIFGLGMFGSNFLLPLYLQQSLGYTALQTGEVFLPMGLLMAVCAPLSGVITDRLSAKVPIITGFLLMTISLQQFSSLSLVSEQSQIMLPLYLRGIGMGFIFTPLSAIALLEIPREKMAQASGLINVIRQIGGSFGIAIFGTILTRRTIFQTAAMGEAINPYSVVFGETISRLFHHSIRVSGGTVASAMAKANALILIGIEKQAFVGAMNDVYFIASLLIAISIPPALFLKTKKRRDKRNAQSAPEL